MHQRLVMVATIALLTTVRFHHHNAEYPEVYRHFDTVLKTHGQLSVTWMNLPSFETFNVLACDFATNISTGHFDEFCMPILRREAELFRHDVFHMDGPGVARHVDSILTLPNLAALAVLFVSPTLHATGLASAEVGKNGILAGTIGWFATAPFWIKRQ